ncbi:hypothetical protein [Ferruginibacter sp. HRS2-29]|uniref:hypothetical protein n=1 Tax=Ferruginibacter sp. HRS2-29 TaxID=2487334 RepID=UPI0020CD5288|nr:hypothetical protein [Ferruginibacter sp. HRS2-29]MCP9751955.1 hypothetical protein [Ferruginibacter sp. HRS2-29]
MSKIYTSIRNITALFLLFFLAMGNAQAQYSGTGVFTKITAAADLTDGYYVIAYGTTYAMNNSYVSTTYLDRTAISPTSGTTITNPATSIVWKVETNGSGKSIYNEATAKYISYTGSSNNVQVVDAVTANNQRWTLAYTSGGMATITNVAVGTRELQYNTSAPRFACYTGSQADLTFYKMPSTYYWDVSTAAGLGGSATWGTTFTTAVAGNTALVTAPITAQAVFQGTAGTVGLTAATTEVASLTFNVGSYAISTVSAGAKVLNGDIILSTNNITFSPMAGSTLTVNDVVSGTTAAANVALTKNGAGNLLFPGAANTFTGKVVINQGYIGASGESRFGANPASFTANQITLNGGGILASGGAINFSSNRGITLGASGGLFDATGGTITLTNIVTGSGSLTATAGTVLLATAHTYTGNTIVNAGTLQSGVNNAIADASNMVLAGGTFRTGASTGFSDVVGTLDLSANSTLALGTGVHTLRFNNSSALTWAGTTLSITGWAGVAGGSGTAGRIYVGTDATGLTDDQLAKITFNGFTAGAMLRADGELVPAIPAGTITLSPATQALGSYCNAADNTISLTYTTTGTITAPFIELSSNLGSFAGVTTNLGGTVSGSGTFTITATLPSGTAAGTAYRVRIKSTNSTPVISTNNNSNIIITAAVTPTVTIAASLTGAVCSGNNITFTATPANLGGGSVNATTGYQWKIGGVDVAGQTAAAFTTNTLVNGDQVSCAISITGGCVLSSTATSNTINATITTPVTPTVTIAQTSGTNPICTGASATFTATPATLGGGTVASNAYQWKINGGNVAGQTAATFTTTTLVNGDLVSCAITVTGGCITTNTAQSANITMNVVALPQAPAGTITPSDNPACGSAILTYNNSTPEAGVTYYWQTTSTGVSTAINAGTTSYTVTTTTANIYVRGRNATGCWGPAIASGTITINTAVTIGTSPANLSITTGGNATFTVAATGTAALAYQWQESPDGVNWTNIGTNSATLNLTSVPLSKNGYRYRVLVSNFCGSKTSGTAILTVADGPCFEMNGADFPARTGYTEISGTAMRLASGSSAGSIATAALTGVSGNVSVKFQGKGWSASEGTVTVSFGAASQTINMFNTAYQEKVMNFTGVPAGSVLKFSANTDERVYIENVKVFCLPNCIPAAITLQPATGPVGTIVKITGSNFTAGTTVDFNGTAATTTFVSATELSVVVPAGATSGTVTVNTSLACDSEAPFTVITSADNGCELTAGGGAATDLIIYEILDEQTGSGGKIVLFNGTSSTINLSGYSIYRADNYGGTYTNYLNLTGSIAAGSIGVAGVTGSDCALPATNGTMGSGYNGNDGIQLRKSSGAVVVDDVDVTIGSAGYYLKRALGQYYPRATFTASDWIITDIGDGFDCSVVGITPQSLGNSPAISVQPANQALTCNSTTASYTVNATQGVSGGRSLVFQWYELAPGAANWVTISTGVVSNATSSTITITPAAKDGYQYYVQVREDDATCFIASTAVNIKVVAETRIIYRSRVANGNWTSAASWEMSNDGNTWVNACVYPTEANSQEVIIKNGSKINISGDITVDIDKVTIVNGGTLELGTVDGLNIRNGNTGGADLVVEGTFIDRSNSGSGNGVTFATSATWQMGTAGTFIKTNNGAVAHYRAAYQAGISSIPATATWIYRFTTDGTTVPVIAIDMFYPNLVFESTNGAHNANALAEKFTGASGYTTVKGTLDIGGTGTGTMAVYNENTNALPMQVLGGIIVRTGNTLSSFASTAGTGFEVKGDITVDGTFTVNSGSKGVLKLSGAADQAINGTGAENMNIWELRLANPGRVVIPDRNVNVLGRMFFENNSGLRFGTGDIVIRSTAANTASIAPIGTATLDYSGTGRFIVERYIPTNTHGRAWQFLSTPTTGSQTIREAWQENNAPMANAKAGFGTLIYSPYGTAGGFDNTGASANLKRYLPLVDQWDNGPASTSEPVNDPKGYMLFVRGDRTSTQTHNNPSSATVLRTRGQIYAPGNLPGEVVTEPGKYQSVGNPYASSIDIRALLKTNLTDEIYIWDPTLGGSFGFGKYRTLTVVGSNYEITPTGGVYPVDIVNRLQSGQAFFIKAQTGLVGKIAFSEAAKTDSSRLVNRGGSGEEVELLKINLLEKIPGGENTLLDGAMAIFGNYSRNYDNNDGQKIPGTNENTSFRAGNSLAAVERRPSPENNDTLHLELTGTRQVAYQWQLDTRNMLLPGRTAWVYDRFLQLKTPIDLNGQTLVDFVVTADPLSSARDRFKIVFNRQIAGPTPVTFVSVTATRNAERSIRVQWKVENELNITGYTVERSADGQHFTGILTADASGISTYQKDDLGPLAADNYYRIKATGPGGAITYSNIVKVAAINLPSSITIAPNPVENKTAQLRFVNQPAGNYQVKIFNKIGQVVFDQQVKVSGGNFLKKIELGNIVAGSYSVLILNTRGELMSQEILVK